MTTLQRQRCIVASRITITIAIAITNGSAKCLSVALTMKR